jgi:hypothetical protein
MLGPSSIQSPHPAQRSGFGVAPCRLCHLNSASAQTLRLASARDSPRALQTGMRSFIQARQASGVSPTGSAFTSFQASHSAAARSKPPSTSAMAARSSKTALRSAGRLPTGTSWARGTTLRATLAISRIVVSVSSVSGIGIGPAQESTPCDSCDSCDSWVFCPKAPAFLRL